MANDPWLEPVGVSPRVDCVFKAILGDPSRTSVLLDFLAAVLEPEIAIVSVEPSNPVHLPDFIGDDGRSVDVKATDRDGRTYQIEMQSWNASTLKERMLYTWADLYEEQLEEGDNYRKLRPVIAIWILARNTLRDAPAFHHRFGVYDPSDGVRLTEHLEIHTLELAKWRRSRGGASPALERWMAFFAEGESWVDVPPELKVPALEEAMSILREFKTNAAWNDVYRSRLDWQRQQRAEQEEKAEAIAQKEVALAEKEHAVAREAQAVAREEQALARESEAVARERALREKMRKAGIDPDA